MNIHFLLIGDVQGRRVQSFLECLQRVNIHHYQVITWQEILRDVSVLAKSLKENTIVKLEPPEKDLEIYRQLLGFGETAGILTKKQIQNIDFSHYPIIAPRQWYEGCKAFFAKTEEVLQPHLDKNIFLMNDFTESLIMMDKEATYRVLAGTLREHQYNLPARLEVPDSYHDFEEMYGGRPIRCFIKLRYGSGGTGVLAYRNNPRLLREQVFTSLNFKRVAGRTIFYSNYRVNCFTDRDTIQTLIDWVLANGAHMEAWIPKATYRGYAFDTRALVINQETKYLVSRLSKKPITNLHLKNKRMESAAIMAGENLQRISRAATDVMKVFPRSLYAGIDVVCSQDYKPYIVDVNPFGDLFHHLLGTDRNVYYVEIAKAIDILRGRMNGRQYE